MSVFTGQDQDLLLAKGKSYKLIGKVISPPNKISQNVANFSLKNQKNPSFPVFLVFQDYKPIKPASFSNSNAYCSHHGTENEKLDRQKTFDLKSAIKGDISPEKLFGAVKNQIAREAGREGSDKKDFKTCRENDSKNY